MSLAANPPERIDPVHQSITLLGRGPACQVRLPHPRISRVHAELRLQDGRLTVFDRGSRAGVRVNGQKITSADLRDRDEIEFGPVRYTVVGQHLERQATPGVEVNVSGLKLDRAGRMILDGVELTLAPNEFVGILGASGSGKTTLLKCLAGYLRPQGLIEFDGRPLDEDSFASVQPDIGYVNQGDLLIPSLTGRENLRFAGQLRMAGRLRAEELRAVVSQLLDRLGLDAAVADRPVRSLSGGQRRRLNVGLELIGRPRLLLLDEPTTGLDPYSETRLMKLLKEITTDGTTIVCTTHVLDNLALFDRVLVVAEKRIVYAGPPGGLLSHYGANRYAELYEALEHRVCVGPYCVVTPGSKPAQMPPPAPAPVPSAPLSKKQKRLAAKSRLLAKPKVESAAQPVTVKQHKKPVRTAPKLGFYTQIRVLTQRTFAAIWRDRAWLAITVLQPIGIGMLIVLSQLLPVSASVALTFLVVAAVWLGLNNTAREVVRERAVYVRERLLGVTPLGYLSAKIVSYGVVGLLQVAVLALLVGKLNLIPDGDTAGKHLAGWSWGYTTAVLFGAYFGAMTLGLLVSTLARSEESAVAALPLIILPQLLLTGVATGVGTVEDHGPFQPIALIWQAETAPPPPPAATPSFADLPIVGEDGTVEPAAPPEEVMENRTSRDRRRWVLEAVSAVTFTRPALDLLHSRWYYEPDDKFRLTRLDAIHLAVLIGLTGTLLYAGYRRADRCWLRNV